MRPARACSYVGCDRSHEARDLCATHYMQHRRAGTLDSHKSRRDDWGARFLRSFDDSAGTDECWLWTGYVNGQGYGVIGLEDGVWQAHRLSYALHNGGLPDDALVCHHCDNPPCVNPAHLYAGTVVDNARDMVVRNRTTSPLTPDGVGEIRRLYATGDYSFAALRKRFGVSTSTLWNAVNRKTWDHVA